MAPEPPVLAEADPPIAVPPARGIAALIATGVQDTAIAGAAFASSVAPR